MPDRNHPHPEEARQRRLAVRDAALRRLLTVTGRRMMMQPISIPQYRPHRDARLVAGDLLAVSALAAQHFDEAAGAVNRHARRTDLDDLADLLAADRSEDAGGDLSRVEDLQLLAADRRPGGRRRIAA